MNRMIHVSSNSDEKQRNYGCSKLFFVNYSPNQWRRHGGTGGDSSPPPILKSRQKLSKKNGIKLVGYTFRLKNYVKIQPFLSDLSELAPPLLQIWCYCGHVIKSRTMRHLNFGCQLTLIHMGFFRATIYGGGFFPPPSENYLRLLRIQYNLA